MIQIGAPRPPAFDAPIELLIDCHRRIEHFFGIVESVLERAVSAAPTREDLGILQKAIDYFHHGLPRHTQDEEQSLFPLLRMSAGLTCLSELENDHIEEGRRLGPVLDHLKELVDGNTPGEAALDALRTEVADLHSVYSSHIEREERDVFPVAARMLNSADLQALGREMAARRDIVSRP